MEIVLRAALIFFFLWFVTRVAGRSTLGELSTFQLILFLVMGDLVADAILHHDTSVTGAVLAVSTIAVLTVVVSWVNSRSRRTSRIVHGVPVVVVSDGELLMEALQRERMGVDELLAAARGEGIERVAEIRVAVLETNGQLSFFTGDPDTSGGSTQPSAG